VNSAGDAVWVLSGPTASGKSALALELAKRLGGEIVSADSMQLYRGLDIGTAKPTAEERARVAHHLLDVLDWSEAADVFDFVRRADAAIADIRSRGRVPVVAGGTGMYLKALLYGLDDLPGDAALRAELDAAYDSVEGFAALKERMAALDPAGLAQCGHHRRKLIRALEVFLLSGRSIADLQGRRARDLRYPVHAFTLVWPRATLKERIAARTDEMLASGWIEEAERALAAGLLRTPTAHQALGYALIGEYLAGRLDRGALAERIATATWQLARRQITWFRHQHPEARMLEMPRTAGELIEMAAGEDGDGN